MPGIREVFHARFEGHSYPLHTHDAWTLLIVDSGAVSYRLDQRDHLAHRDLVTLLPPRVPHDGRSVLPQGFRKRVLYLDYAPLGEELSGAAVDRPDLLDPLLRLRVHQLHNTLLGFGERLEVQSRLAFIVERLVRHLRPRAAGDAADCDPKLAHRFRELLDASMPQGLTLDEAADVLDCSAAHLVRAFGREYGIPPHRYVTGYRVDLARRLLLEGCAPADVAALAGFYDQSHLTRHFKQLLGTSPARYARSGPRL